MRHFSDRAGAHHQGVARARRGSRGGLSSESLGHHRPRPRPRCPPGQSGASCPSCPSCAQVWKSTGTGGLVHHIWYTARLPAHRSLATIIAGCGLVLLILASSLLLLGNGPFARTSPSHRHQALVPPDPEYPLPPSPSQLKSFPNGAVCVDSAACAEMGRDALARNGSAVDAALTALVCNGLLNMQSMGFGGGFFMTIYQESTGEAVVLNARDVAPSRAHRDMFREASPKAPYAGALSLTVPGELAGYWLAHERFGRLPWAELFRPSIELCERGYELSRIQHIYLVEYRENVFADPTLSKWFVDERTSQLRLPGSLIRPEELCATMRRFAEEGPEVFYNGSLGAEFVEDLQGRGSIIELRDLQDYQARWEAPVESELSDGTRLVTTGAPGSGPILAAILNILDELRWNETSLGNLNDTVRLYHQMIESFKFAYAQRPELGDGNLTELVDRITSREFAREVLSRIDEGRSHEDPRHYGLRQVEESGGRGTAHISVLGPDGDAVSVTSSINVYFGSGIVSERTGILTSSGMGDFGIPGRSNLLFEVPANERNFIGPGKRPLSSMSPAILVDGSGLVRMVVGAAGGTKIPTATAFAMARYLWLGEDIKQAVDAPRIHHQLLPDRLDYEYGVPAPVVEGLRALGHQAQRYSKMGSIVCAIVREPDGTLRTNADFRKAGDVFGL